MFTSYTVLSSERIAGNTIGGWLQIHTLVGTVLFPTRRLYAHSLCVVCVKEYVIRVPSHLMYDGEL